MKLQLTGLLAIALAATPSWAASPAALKLTRLGTPHAAPGKIAPKVPLTPPPQLHKLSKTVPVADTPTSPASGSPVLRPVKTGLDATLPPSLTEPVSAVALPQVEQMSVSLDSPQPTQAVRAPLPILTLEIEMDPREATLLFHKSSLDKSSFPATLLQNGAKHAARIEVDGQPIRGVVKKSVRLMLQDGNWHGYQQIPLDAMSADASMMRQWLSWDLARALGMITPATAYTRLYINRQYAGLFLFVEPVTPAIFARAGLTEGGQLLHPDDESYCGDLGMASLKKSPLTRRSCYEKLSPPDGDFTDVARLIQQLDSVHDASFDRFVRRNFYTDSLVSWLTANALLQDGNTYSKNYYLYRTPDDEKWLVMPAGFRGTFGRGFDPYLPAPQNQFNDNFTYFYTPDIGSPAPLKVKLLASDQYYAKIRAKIRHLLGIGEPTGDRASYGWFAPERLAARIDAIQAYTLKDAELDPYSVARVSDYEEQVAALKYYALAHASYLNAVVVGDQANWRAPVRLPPNPDEAPKAVEPPAVVTLSPTTFHAEGAGTLSPLPQSLVDPSWGRLTTALKLHRMTAATTFSAEVFSAQTPPQLPPGQLANECLNRRWILQAHTASDAEVVADVTLEYLQENSKKTEVGTGVPTQADLQLWLRNGDDWQPQFTYVNPQAKTLTVRKLTLPPNQPLEFVACADVADPESE